MPGTEICITLTEDMTDHIRKISWQRVIGNASSTISDLVAKLAEAGVDIEKDAGLADQVGTALMDLDAMSYHPDTIRSLLFNAWLAAESAAYKSENLREQVNGHLFYGRQGITKGDLDKASEEFRLAARRCDEEKARRGNQN